MLAAQRSRPAARRPAAGRAGDRQGPRRRARGLGGQRPAGPARPRRGRACQRVYGGALPASPAVGDYAARQDIAVGSKQRVAARAAALIQPGSTVILDGGTTALALARTLPADLNALVVTHSPTVAAALADHPTVEILLLGGRVFKHSVVACGAAAVEAAAAVNADVFFLGVTGVHPDTGLTTGDADEAAMKRALSRRAARHLRAGEQREDWRCVCDHRAAAERRCGRHHGCGSCQLNHAETCKGGRLDPHGVGRRAANRDENDRSPNPPHPYHARTTVAASRPLWMSRCTTCLIPGTTCQELWTTKKVGTSSRKTLVRQAISV